MKTLAIIRANTKFLPLAERAKKSFVYFHPDCDCLIANSDDWVDFFTAMRLYPVSSTRLPYLAGVIVAYMKMTVEHYDLIIMLDADTVTTGRLDEMLTDDYDIGTTNSIRKDYPNCGVWSSRSTLFVRTYTDYLKDFSSMDNDGFVFFTRWMKNLHKAVVKDIDGDGSGVWYNERSRQWWNRLEVRDNQLYTAALYETDRIVKVLHWAGGVGLGVEKRMSCSLFSDDVKEWLNEITSSTTLTDYDGEIFGDFLKKYYKL